MGESSTRSDVGLMAAAIAACPVVAQRARERDLAISIANALGACVVVADVPEVFYCAKGAVVPLDAGRNELALALTCITRARFQGAWTDVDFVRLLAAPLHEG